MNVPDDASYHLLLRHWQLTFISNSVYVRNQTLARWSKQCGSTDAKAKQIHQNFRTIAWCKIQTIQRGLGDDVNISGTRRADAQDAQENLPTSIVG
jgi:hypothetical protein